MDSLGHCPHLRGRNVFLKARRGIGVSCVRWAGSIPASPLSRRRRIWLSFYDGLAERYPKTNRGWNAISYPLYEEVVGSSSLTLLVMFGAVAHGLAAGLRERRRTATRAGSQSSA